MSLRLVPVDYPTAAQFVDANHRHHRRPQGHKFSLGVADAEDQLVGVAMVGRPVARHFDGGLTLEVLRSATDGTPNANSMLYGACSRATFALGYRRLITYTQGEESGSSLKAAGWTVIASRPPRKGWDTPSRRRELRGNEGMPRQLWEATQ